jgi:DNA-binding CsgD family transcriptional regulator
MSKSVALQRWPVVPRDEEFKAIRSALMTGGSGCGIVLIGDAGVGKTTLARLVTQSLAARVQWVAATESARSIPLGVFAHLVGTTTARDQMAFLAAARETILAEKHTIIGVDDAHLLDQLSATLLHQLAIDGTVRIVATIRGGEVVPDAITSLWKDGYLERLHLEPFTKGQCSLLIEQALGGRVEGLSADLIWDASGGNALFVRHLVEGALEAGTLRQVRGIWQLRGRAAVTSELASLVDVRIESLPADVLHALHLLTFSEPLDLDILSELAGADAVEQAEVRGLVRITEEPERHEVRFTHPLFGEVIRRRLGVAAARRVRGELVRSLLERPLPTASQRIGFAELALDSDVQPAVETLTGAARDAVALGNITLGERLARAAVNRGGGLIASELLARALLWKGEAAESDQILSAFDPNAMTELDLTRWGSARIANLQWSMGDADSADEVFDLLWARVSQPPLRVFLEGLRAASLAFKNQLHEAISLSRQVFAAPDAPPSAVEWAVIGGTLALALCGRLDEVGPVAERGHQVEDKVGGLLRYLSAFGEIRALVIAGDFDAAERRSTDILAISSPGQYLAWGMANVLAGTVQTARGRFGEAVEGMEQTVAALTAESAATWGFPARIMLAQCYCALGRVDAARKMVAELRIRFGRHVAVFEPQLRLTEAWLAAAEGTVSTAVKGCMDAAEMAAAAGQHGIELLAVHDAIRFGDRECVPRLVDLAEKVGGRLAGAYRTHAAAAVDRDPEQLYAAAQEFERIGALLSAADAFADASAVYRDAEHIRGALAAAAEADRLVAQCGGLQTPAVKSAANPLPISSREREIAELIAAGATNKEIAERLVLSPRTVENHIYRACSRLGVGDREQLGRAVAHR